MVQHRALWMIVDNEWIMDMDMDGYGYMDMDVDMDVDMVMVRILRALFVTQP